MPSAAAPALPLVDIPVPRGKRGRLSFGQLLIFTPFRSVRRTWVHASADILLRILWPSLRHCARPHLRHHASHVLWHKVPHRECRIHWTRVRKRGSLCPFCTPSHAYLAGARRSASLIGRFRHDRTALADSRILVTLTCILVTFVTLALRPGVRRGIALPLLPFALLTKPDDYRP